MGIACLLATACGDTSPRSTASAPTEPRRVRADTRPRAATLAAIGPPSRSAIPDLRLAVARTGDPSGRLRAAIRSLESAGR